MPQPPKYERTKDFTVDYGDNTDHNALNSEFDAAASSINKIRENLALLQRDDGKLKQGVVTADSVDPSFIDEISAGVVSQVQGYAADAQASAVSANAAATTAVAASTTAVSARDTAVTSSNAAALASQSAATSAGAAQTSQVDAAASKAAAAASQTAAATSATNAAASATSAGNSATTATTQAGIATTKAGDAATSAASASASLSDFKGRYYGPLAADPTLDPNGNAMDVGDLYANTATGELRRYSGSAWVTAFGGIPNDGTVTTAKLSTAVRDGMIGKVGHFARNTAPTGWLKANGAAVSRTTYADLFSKMGILFGAGDGSTTFNVPDLRGEWIRGWDDARGVDVGRAFGSSQAEMIGPHPHPIRASVSGYTGGNPAVLYAAGDNNGNTQVPGGGATYGVQNNSGTENRVRNVALLACIQF